MYNVCRSLNSRRIVNTVQTLHDSIETVHQILVYAPNIPISAKKKIIEV